MNILEKPFCANDILNIMKHCYLKLQVKLNFNGLINVIGPFIFPERCRE